jgi:O-antigen/teichoic acid export membrane protein
MLKKIKGKFKTQEGKTLASNFLSLSLLRVVAYAFSLVVLPYLASVIGVDRFGELAFAASVIVFFETFVDYGFNYTATRDVSKYKDDLHYVSKVFSIVMVARILLVVLSLVILLICILIFPSFYEKKLLLLLTFTYVIGYSLFPEWVFQALEKMKYITVLNIVSKGIFTLLVFVFITEQEDYIYQPVLTATGFFFSGVISLVVLRRKFGVRFIRPSFTDIKDTIKSSTNMFISLILPNLYTNFSIVYLRKTGGDFATGIYSSGSRFTGLAEQIMQVLSRTFYPFLARRMDKHDFYIKIGLVFSLVTSVSLFFLADFLIDLFFTDEFKSAVLVVRIMAIGPFFLFLINTYGPNYLVLVGKEKWLRNIILFCSVFGLILTLVLTTFYGYVGVAITITFIWGLRGGLTWYFAQKHKKAQRN